MKRTAFALLAAGILGMTLTIGAARAPRWPRASPPALSTVRRDREINPFGR